MRLVALAFCLLVPVVAYAEDPQLVQWDRTDKSLADYIADGFELKAVVANYGRASTNPNAAVGSLYYLQKATALVTCTDVEILNNGELTGRTSRTCFRNVQPHPAN
jgi:hypothetical protein